MKEYQRLLTVLVAVLVVCLPFYTADAFAAVNVQITENHGTAGYNGFLDAVGDTWIVKALISGVSSLTENQTELTLFGGANFDWCQATTGGYECGISYIFPPYIQKTLPMSVKVFDEQGGTLLGQAQSTISWDGTNPSLTNLVVNQMGNEIQINFSVGDRPFVPSECLSGACNCSGIKKIEIYDNNTLLGEVPGTNLTTRCGMNSVFKKYTLNRLTGPGLIKVKAIDNINRYTLAQAAYDWDGSFPTIDANSLVIKDLTTGELLGEWVEDKTYDIEISVNVTENGPTLGCEAITGIWTGTRLNDDVVGDLNGTFTCIWRIDDAYLSGNYDFIISARDNVGNIDTEEWALTFTVDDIEPSAVSFESVSKVGDINYVTALPGGSNTFVAVFDEDESGMDASTVRGDFSSILGSVYDDVAADNCTEVGGDWHCYFVLGKADDFDGTKTVTLLRGARDKMGNEAEGLPLTVMVALDDSPPNISEVSVLPAYEARRFVQTGDIVKISFKVTDDKNFGGAEIDLSSLITGAGTESATCAAAGNNTWNCLYTASTGVTADSPVNIEIFAYDEIGNEKKLLYQVDVLEPVGVVITPNFWTMGLKSMSPKSGIDMEAVTNFKQYVYFTLELNTNGNVEILETKVMNCAGDAMPNVARYSMINKWQGSRNPILIFEFNPFTPNENKTEEFNCTFNLYTRSGNKVYTTPEVESVLLEVPFYETVFDSASDRLERKLESTEKSIRSDFWNTISVLSDIVQLCRIACAILPTYEFLKTIYEALSSKADVLRSNQYTYTTAISICYASKELTDEPQAELEQIVNKFCKIISCRASILAALGMDLGKDLQSASDAMVSGVETWQNAGNFLGESEVGGVTYNLDTTQAAKEAKISTTDPYSNIAMAIVHLCLPALIYNLEKYRQIDCRYYTCLKDEVGSGVATIDSCEALRGYMRCKYFIGPLFSFIPYASFLDGLVGKLKSFITDPVGIFMMAGQWVLRGACKGMCVASGTASELCLILAWTYATIDIIQDWVSIYNQIQGLRNDYCRQIGFSPLSFT